jgi:serine/threonine-protein kinase
MLKQRISVLLVIATLLTGCGGLVSVTGSGNVVTQEEAITGFDRLDVSQGFQVDVIQEDTFSVVIRVDDNLVEHLRVVKQGSTLKIGLEQTRSYSDVTLQAEIAMPELVGLDSSGGSRVAASGSGEDIAIDASGGSGADLASFTVVNANVDASGGSQVSVNVSGTLNVDASGGSQVYYSGNPTLGVIDTSGGAQVLSK